MIKLLDGVRILDMSRILAGPWATQLMADMGADVIKIEKPVTGDDTRAAGPPFLQAIDGTPTRESAYYMSANRGKRSITLDISDPRGQEVIRQLVPHCDVVVENYKVGNLARYGLDYESLKAIKPDLVYCSITGFGQTGPLKDRLGYDFIFQGMSGIMSVTGEKDDQPGGGPQKVGVAYTDLMTGMYAAVSILGALYSRQQTQQGQHIDLALLDVAVSSLANMVSNYLVSGKEPIRMGNAHANLVPYGVFPALDGHIIIAIGNDDQFRAFCREAGNAALADDMRFMTNPNRIIYRSDLIPVMEAITATRTSADWIASLEAVSVPCGPINSISQALHSPQIQARELVAQITHPLGGTIPMVTNPAKFSNATKFEKAPPLLGEHTRDILAELCRLSDESIDTLYRDGVL